MEKHVKIMRKKIIIVSTPINEDETFEKMFKNENNTLWIIPNEIKKKEWMRNNIGELPYEKENGKTN